MPLNTRAFSTVSTEFPASPFASTVGTGGCAPDSHKFPTKECNPMRVQGADTTRHRHYIEMVFLLLFVTVAVVVTVAIYLFRWQVYFLFFFVFISYFSFSSGFPFDGCNQISSE